MTIIIATAAGMVSDSGEFKGGVVYRAAQPKIMRNAVGWLSGASGDVGKIAVYRKWFMGGMPEGRPKLEGDRFSAILLSPSGDAWLVEDDLTPHRVPFPAVCGEEMAEAFVTGAMAAGANALRAIVLACEYCVWVRGPVHVENLVSDGLPSLSLEATCP